MEQAKPKKHIFFALGIYATVFFILLLISNIDAFRQWFGVILRLFRPLIIGLIIAYLFNPFFRFFEYKMLFKIRQHSLRRGLSLFFTYLVLFLIVAILMMLIIPQLIESIVNFTSNSETFLNNTVSDINGFIATLNERFSANQGNGTAIPYLNAQNIRDNVQKFFASLNFDAEKILGSLDTATIFSTVENAFTVVVDVILGLFISLYFLHTKEKRYAQVMRLRRAFFSDSVNEKITRVCTVADKSFGGFLRGKILDSCIVGVLVYIAISIMGVPYAILIAVIVAITDIVPVIGPFIGVIPSAIIILLTDPSKVIPFLLCILIVQQIDGNIIAPKILGENTGVSSLCVIIAISTMGGLWGLVGMVVGVPLFATVLELTSDYLDGRLKKKGLFYEDKAMPLTEGASASDAEPSLIQQIRMRELDADGNDPDGGTGDLSAVERFRLNTYALLHKYHISTKQDVPIPEDFIEEEAELAMAVKEELDAMDALEQSEQQEADSENTERADELSLFAEEAYDEGYDTDLREQTEQAEQAKLDAVEVTENQNENTEAQ